MARSRPWNRFRESPAATWLPGARPIGIRRRRGSWSAAGSRRRRPGRIADRLFGGWRSAAPAPRAVGQPCGHRAPAAHDRDRPAQSRAGDGLCRRAHDEPFGAGLLSAGYRQQRTRAQLDQPADRGSAHEARAQLQRAQLDAGARRGGGAQRHRADPERHRRRGGADRPRPVRGARYAARRRGCAATPARLPCRCGRPGARDQRRVQRGGRPACCCKVRRPPRRRGSRNAGPR